MKNEQKGRVSGFTLLEMMIVIAIIGILSGVLVPAMMGYTKNSRLNSANSNAKVLFNSVQTVMQEYEFLDRNAAATSAFYGTGDVKQGKIYIRVNQGVIADVDSKSDTDASATALTADWLGVDCRTAAPATFSNRLDRLFPDYREVSWAVLIQDYSVRGVLCADDNRSNYIGAYPLKARERANLASVSSTCSAVTIAGASRDQMMNYCNDAWNVSPPAAW